MVVTQFKLYTNVYLYEYAHNSDPKGSPDMILNAFDVKFHNKNEGTPPKACKPPTQIPKTLKMHQEIDAPPAHAPDLCDSLIALLRTGAIIIIGVVVGHAQG